MNQQFKEVYRLAALLCLLHFVNSNFSESPTSQEVNVGGTAIFRCQHETADFLRWMINGTILSRSMRPPGISTDEADNLVQILTIVGRLDYNQTEVVCVAKFDSGMTDETTPGAFLYVHDDLAIKIDPIVTTALPTSDFFIYPQETVTAVWTPATFYCQHRNSNAFITWSLNGTRIDSGLMNVPLTTQRVLDQSGRLRDSLSITAHPDFNMTTIQCIVLYQNSEEEQEAPSVQLLIQGELLGVTNLRRHPWNASVAWLAPYSLNITNTEPDIAYCISVINITCGGRENVMKKCNILEPFVTNTTILSEADLYEINVTPFSNVPGAVNGTTQKIRETYIYSTASTISAEVYKNSSSNTVDVDISIQTRRLLNQITPGSFIVSLESINGTVLRNFTTADTVILTESLLIIHVSGVPFRDLWNCTIYVTRCQGIAVSDITTLSTFDLQNIAISNTSDSITVDCKTINGSQAIGMLIIAFSDIDASDIHYGVSQSDNQGRITTILSCLPGNHYSINLYVIDEKGLPLPTPASLPFAANTSGDPSYTDDTQCDRKKPIDYNVYHQDDNVCVECNTTCVVIVHANVTLLNSSYLSLHSVHVLNQPSDNGTLVECIPDIDLDDYQLGVIPLLFKPMVPTTGALSTTDDAEDKGQSVIVIAIPSVSAFLIITGLVIATLCVIKRRYNNRKSGHAKEVHELNEPSCTHHEQDPSNSSDGKTSDSTSQTDEPNTNQMPPPERSTDATLPEIHVSEFEESKESDSQSVDLPCGDTPQESSIPQDQLSSCMHLENETSDHQLRVSKSCRGFRTPDSGIGTPVTRPGSGTGIDTPVTSLRPGSGTACGHLRAPDSGVGTPVTTPRSRTDVYMLLTQVLAHQQQDPAVELVTIHQKIVTP